jgi:hypothetical protein
VARELFGSNRDGLDTILLVLLLVIVFWLKNSVAHFIYCKANLFSLNKRTILKNSVSEEFKFMKMVMINL